MKFVRFGDVAVNMNTVKNIRTQDHDNRQSVRIEYVDGNYERFYKDDTSMYEEADAWIKEQPYIERSIELNGEA